MTFEDMWIGVVFLWPWRADLRKRRYVRVG
jgi:hypothetical protein